MIDLQPCPFCGGAASKSAYDRGIDIGCEPCGYSRHFPGLLQTVRNDKPITQYRNGAGGITEIPASEATEFYHADADERAAEAWNSRAGAQNAEAIRNQAADEEMHQHVRDAVAEALTRLYCCGRVWSAWNVGTMSQDDFWPADEDDDVIENVTSAAIRALQSGTASTKTGEAE